MTHPATPWLRRPGHPYRRRGEPPGPGGALTEAGEAAFLRLRDTAIAFDAKLRAGLVDADLATLSTLLYHLAANVGAEDAAAPWSGLAARHPE